MTRKVILTGKSRPMPSPLQRGQYVLTLECGHLHSATRRLPFPDPFDWPDAPAEKDCKTCDFPPQLLKWEWPTCDVLMPGTALRCALLCGHEGNHSLWKKEPKNK